MSKLKASNRKALPKSENRGKLSPAAAARIVATANKVVKGK